MFTEAIPGGGPGGQGPSVSVPADGLCGEDEDAWLRRMMAEADADHTIPWPEGPSCECNLGPPCRYHHRNKQAPGWKLEQPEPGVMKWTGPSGRVHTTYPTKYII